MKKLAVPGKVVVTWDDEAGALYVKLVRVNSGRKVRTELVCDSPLVNIDWDGDDVWGIEVIP